MTHGERHATRFDFTRTKMPSTRDRRRTRRVSAAVLTDMASTAAVCLWVAQLCRLRHRQLQGSADDADPILRTSPPPTEARAERMTSPTKKIKEYGARQVRSEQDAVPLKELHNDRLPQGNCAHRDIYRRIGSATNRQSLLRPRSRPVHKLLNGKALIALSLCKAKKQVIRLV